MSLKVVDRMKEFAQKNEVGMDRALNSMAIDIERLSKAQVPFKFSPLQTSGRHIRRGRLDWRVEYNKVYALYQHEGQRAGGTHIVRKYTTPGTKKHYLKDPGKIIADKANNYIKREARRVKV